MTLHDGCKYRQLAKLTLINITLQLYLGLFFEVDSGLQQSHSEIVVDFEQMEMVSKEISFVIYFDGLLQFVSFFVFF